VGLDLLLCLVIPSLGAAVFVCGLEEAFGMPIFLLPAMQLALRVSYSGPKRVKGNGSQARLRKHHFPLFELSVPSSLMVRYQQLLNSRTFPIQLYHSSGMSDIQSCLRLETMDGVYQCLEKLAKYIPPCLHTLIAMTDHRADS
jgi:hypothetical protein